MRLNGFSPCQDCGQSRTPAARSKTVIERAKKPSSFGPFSSTLLRRGAALCPYQIASKKLLSAQHQ